MLLIASCVSDISRRAFVKLPMLYAYADTKGISEKASLNTLTETGNESLHYFFYTDVSIDSMLEFQKVVHQRETKILHLHIQSNGGSLISSLYGCDLIEASTIPIYTHVEGLVASAASLLSVCGHRRYMSPDSFLLLHQPSAILSDRVKVSDLEDEVYNIRMVEERMVDVYVRHSNLSKDEIRSLIRKERR